MSTERKSHLGFIQICVPGFHLRGDFPVSRMEDLVRVAVEAIEAGRKTQNTPIEQQHEEDR